MSDSVQTQVYQLETTASEAQLSARDNLKELFRAAPMSEDNLLFNLGMFTRGSLLVKFLVMHELYQLFKFVPGCCVEFGTWYGQNLILLENLRAIHEPFNKQRKIIGFDTFTGYENLSAEDKHSLAWTATSYSTGEHYPEYLKKLLRAHESMNVLGHVQTPHELIEGDIAKTAPDYFKKHPELIVAFAYFDVGTYAVTKAALKAMMSHLVPGSILLMDELTWSESPGEAIAFKEEMKRPYELKKCEFYPSKSIVKILA